MQINRFYADFSHTAVIPKVTSPILHEETLRDQVAGRLKGSAQTDFTNNAQTGWELSQTLKRDHAPAEQRYDAWLKPFKYLLTTEDIEADITKHWARNDSFEWVIRQIAEMSGHSSANKLPLTFTSGAINPMIQIAMQRYYPDLLKDVASLNILGVNIEMKNGVFTGNLLPIDPKAYAGCSAFSGEEFLMIGDHFMRPYGFGDRLIVIYEPDGSCDKDTVMRQLRRYF